MLFRSGVEDGEQCSEPFDVDPIQIVANHQDSAYMRSFFLFLEVHVEFVGSAGYILWTQLEDSTVRFLGRPKESVAAQRDSVNSCLDPATEVGRAGVRMHSIQCS